MLEQAGDIWEAAGKDDYVVITTCGTIKKNKWLVMGRGIARQAAERYPWLPKAMGEAVRRNGLSVELFLHNRLIAFPTKHQFYEDSDPSLIETSVIQLVQKVEEFQLFNNPNARILIPRPGCNNGKLDWADVEPILRQYLVDSRYVIFNREESHS
jgi:hypothetical protein